MCPSAETKAVQPNCLRHMMIVPRGALHSAPEEAHADGSPLPLPGVVDGCVECCSHTAPTRDPLDQLGTGRIPESLASESERARCVLRLAHTDQPAL